MIIKCDINLGFEIQIIFKVFNYLHNMKTYTELSNVNSIEDVDCVDSDETSWKLINAKILYKSGKIM